jgi:hypothetical protein
MALLRPGFISCLRKSAKESCTVSSPTSEQLYIPTEDLGLFLFVGDVTVVVDWLADVSRQW